MPPRRADVFFYGLFMDQELLRAKGLAPEGAEKLRAVGRKVGLPADYVASIQ